MKKIVEEIIENIPEFEKDKKKLGKTVNFIAEKNPNIKASKKFKNVLKKRLEGIIELKQNKKFKFSIFAIPAFSFLFVVIGLFYYFDDINFINQTKVNNLREINKISEAELQVQEINEIGEMFEEELQKVVAEDELKNEKLENVETLNIQENNNFSVKQESKDSEISTKIVPDNNNDVILKDDKSSQNQLDDDNITEDSQIMNIFEALEEEYGDEFNTDDSVDSGINNSMMRKAGGDMMLESDGIIPSRMMLQSDYEQNFEEYCELKGGELTGTGELEKCIVDKKECLASQFENGVCEFIEIK